MYSDNKLIRDVANIAAQIMSGKQPVTEKLHPNQQKLDVHEPEKDELTADDFKKLRAKKDEVKKEEVEELDELSTDTLKSYEKKATMDYAVKRMAGDDVEKRRAGVKTARAKLSKEEVDQVDEGALDVIKSGVAGVKQLGKDIKDTAKKVRDEELPKIKQDWKRPMQAAFARESVKVDEGMNRQERERAADTQTARERAIANNPNIAREIERRRKAAEDKKKQPDMKEEVEQIVEYETNKDGKFVHNAKAGRYGGSEKPQDPFAGVRGPGQKDIEKIDAEKKKKQKKFSEMVNLYQEKGLKSLSEMLVKEEPDNEQFTKEIEDAKAKAEGKKRNTEIAKGAVQAVKQEEFDINDINGVQMSTIEERMMTEPEKEKKEEIVKSMKKGMAGFKNRYGDRAKEVMYATATKNAMKD